MKKCPICGSKKHFSSRWHDKETLTYEPPTKQTKPIRKKDVENWLFKHNRELYYKFIKSK